MSNDFPSDSASDAVANLYRTYHAFLIRVAGQKFFVPDDDAQALVHQVFITYLRSGSSVKDVRAWFIGAICNASRQYWRERRKEEKVAAAGIGLPIPNDGTEERLMQRLRVRTLLAGLNERCRQTLCMHYLEGYTAPEIAVKLSTTTGYAEKLIHDCAKRARELTKKAESR